MGRRVSPRDGWYAVVIMMTALVVLTPLPFLSLFQKMFGRDEVLGGS
jgi:hypothetical protein